MKKETNQQKLIKSEKILRSSAAEYITYVAAIGDNPESIEVRYEDENIWLTQKMLASVYNVNVATINEHIKNIYMDNELEEKSTIRKFLIVQKEGNRDVSRNVAHYNLQMIIAIGFKIDNERAVQFRKWANQIVKDYTIKGWVMDDEPKVTRNKIAECTGIKLTTINGIVNAFLSKGIIKETTGYSRNQIFVFEEYINLFLT